MHTLNFLNKLILQPIELWNDLLFVSFGYFNSYFWDILGIRSSIRHSIYLNYIYAYENVAETWPIQ